MNYIYCAVKRNNKSVYSSIQNNNPILYCILLEGKDSP